MSKYQIKKEEARQEAIDWQHSFGDVLYSYEEIRIQLNKFYKLGKRYGLLTEFRENGII